MIWFRASIVPSVPAVLRDIDASSSAKTLPRAPAFPSATLCRLTGSALAAKSPSAMIARSAADERRLAEERGYSIDRQS
ncbi:hypothetical protein FV222_24395 [Methylobacterium sp. WL103]|nr:hypothetical protein FV226_02365 [Methylobacterium sp. WL12]TXM91429.1 hypothetical protein FV222_24395 [Methylobacterium sp. WL103]